MTSRIIFFYINKNIVIIIIIIIIVVVLIIILHTHVCLVHNPNLFQLITHYFIPFFCDKHEVTTLYQP